MCIRNVYFYNDIPISYKSTSDNVFKHKVVFDKQGNILSRHVKIPDNTVISLSKNVIPVDTLTVAYAL